MDNVKWHALEVTGVLQSLQTTASGLSAGEASSRFSRFGPNQLETKKKESLLLLFLAQFKSPLIYVLVFAAIISLLVGKITNMSVILFVLFTNAVMGFIQESRAKRTMESLQKLSAPKARVVRDGEPMEVPGEEIVPGDIILLESGNKIPADSRIIESVRLAINESTLTGESQPVHKTAGQINLKAVLADRLNMVFAGTVTVSGRGKAAVIATGMNTELGRIARTIQATPEPKTPFQRRMAGFGKVIILVVSTQVVFAFAIGYFVRKMEFYEIFMVALSQMVSSIPEGLPIAVTVALSVGMQRMAKRKAYIRKLAAVEGLGSATVICSDKTGTLTRNEMTARRIALVNKDIGISGAGYRPDGELSLKGEKVNLDKEPGIRLILQVAGLCNNARLNYFPGENPKVEVDGDPTEIAYLVAAVKAGIDLKRLNEEFPRTDEIPFEAHLQMMATRHKTPAGQPMVCVKGAPERILEFCGHYLVDGRTEVLTDAVYEQTLDKVSELASDALRVLAFGFWKEIEGVSGEKLDFAYLKNRLVFIGLIGNIDPPRPEAKKAIEECQRAGIKTFMITGDHLNTAEAVALELGIRKNREEEGITGDVLESLTDEELKEVVENFTVFARIEPNHKFRIVKALQAQGEVVAMTGDGINDAPALAAADIGVAMGLTGTDVAKEASGIVIADDNFATIVSAVEEGRGINKNMRKTVLYLLCSSTTEILVLLTALITGLPLPLLALQILWINLITDGALTVNLIMEPNEEVMNQPPQKKDEPIVTGRLLGLLAFRAPIMASGIIGLFFYELSRGQPLNYARTVAFTTLAVTAWINGINCRSEKRSILKMPFFGNKFLVGGILAAIVLQLGVLYLPFLQNLFSTVPLHLTDWLKIVLVASAVFWAEEMRKLWVTKTSPPDLVNITT
ncbi:MAG: HAD-IC family P-type ATPase [Candidatus Omnitrophota bacterium]